MKIGMYSFHCRDAASLAGFWSSVLMRPVDDGATAAYATIGVNDPGPTWMFHQADDDPPSGDNRLMLDFDGGADWTGQADRVEGLGADRVSDNDQNGIRWVVFHDPEGNTFRIFAPRSHQPPQATVQPESR